MKRLIINADDAGLSGEINSAIKKCFERGVITGTSLIASGESFSQACDMLKEIGKSDAGVHLTLTGCLKPCTKIPSAVATVLEDRKAFPESYFGFMARYYRGIIHPEHVYLEFANQIQKVISRGFTVTHLDSHEHVHMFPGVLKVVIALAKEYSIPYVRLPLEPWSVICKDFGLKDLLRHAALKAFALSAKRLIKKSDIKCNDFFLGHFHSGRLNEEILDFMLEKMPEGVTELAVHPAVESPDFLKKFPWYKNASKEMEILTEGFLRQKALDKGIEIVSRKDLL